MYFRRFQCGTKEKNSFFFVRKYFSNSLQVPGMVAGDDRRPEVARGMFVENLKSIGHYNQT